MKDKDSDIKAIAGLLVVMAFGLVGFAISELGEYLFDKTPQRDYRDSYEIACQNNDYEVAHKLLSNLKGDADFSRDEAIDLKVTIN